MGKQEGLPLPDKESPDDSTEAVLPNNPKLRYLDHAFDILRAPEENSLGETTNWRELSDKIRPFQNGLELSDNIREVTVEFISNKIPSLKKIPSLHSLNDEALLEALTHNWFEKIGEEVSGQRREVLLATMAHVVKRIENHTYRQALGEMPPVNLEKLGLDPDTRDLLIQALYTSIKADAMYIRFMAYAQLTPTPAEQAGPVTFSVPGRTELHTTANLFPHDAQFLAKRFGTLAENHAKWSSRPGGNIFKQYLEALSVFYAELDPDKATERQKEVEKLYRDLLGSDFPILITPATEGYYKEPYYDPELKVSVATPDAKKEESSWNQAKEAMSASLEDLDAAQFSERMRDQPIRSVHVFGGFGVNITFNAVAQEKPSILVFLNEQVRAYDRNFPDFVLQHIANAEAVFGEAPSPARKSRLEKISRTDTVLHELSHSIYPDDSSEAQRLGRKPLTVLDEVKADICYRPLIPSMIARGGLEGTKEEWAIGMLASSLRTTAEQPKGDPYHYAAAYSLNNLFEQGAVELEGTKLVVKDFDGYYVAQQQAAEALLSVYRDPKMTETKAARWIKRMCQPNEKVLAAISALKTE